MAVVRQLSIVRQNLLEREGYSPYCLSCRVMPRMNWDGEQFTCPHCKNRTMFDAEFIKEYKAKWNK